MLSSNLRLSLQNLIKQKINTLINLLGLSIGLAGAFLLIHYVSHELRHDRFHKELKQIYRLNTADLGSNQVYDKSPFVLATTLKEDLPGDAFLARTFLVYDSYLRLGQEIRKEEAIYSTDPELFEVLSFEIIAGSLNAFDGSPQAAVISESMAQRWFGEEEAVGKSLQLENQGDVYSLDIVAVYRDVPAYSSFRPELLVSHSISLELMDKLIISSSASPMGADFYADSWFMYFFFDTYVRLPENVSAESLEEIMDGYPGKHYQESLEIAFDLQPYDEIYFGSGHIVANSTGGDRRAVQIYGAVTLLLLLTAALNYILLSISSMSGRRKELGLKMVHGASRRQLFRQVLLESMLFAFVGMVLALTLTEVILPHVSHVLFDKHLTINYTGDWPFSLLVLALTLLIGLGSGSILARRILAERAMGLIRPDAQNGRGRMRFTRAVTILQLAISMGLMVCTGTILSQLRYFTSSDMGFEMEDVISIDTHDDRVASGAETLKERILMLPGAENVSGSMWTLPTRSQMNIGIRKPDEPETTVNLQGLMVDYGIVSTLGLELVEGRDFDPERGIEEGSLILGQSAVKELGIKGQAVGTQLSSGTVIGVVNDFHLHSFHSLVQPTVLRYQPNAVKTLLVRSEEGQMEQLISGIEKLWEEINGDAPFEYTYLMDALAELYSQETRFMRILIIFSVLNLFISLLGIFGLASLNTRRKTREVGIRKVLGATSFSLLNRFVLDYFLMVLLAAVLAFPLAFILMQRWLSGFAYHGKIPVLVFVLAALLSLLVVGGTVIWHVSRTSRANPVDAIRYE